MVIPASLFMMIAALAMAPGSSARGASLPRIVALGDSLTSGHGIGPGLAFPAVLQRQVRQAGYDLEVVNAGVSGDTTGRAVQRFRDALRGDVRILIVALGANDGLRGVPVADVRRNLAAIIEEARTRQIAVLLCGMEALSVYGWHYSVEFHKAYVDLARHYDVPLVPFMMLGVLGNRALMQPDHLHPNADGARVMAAQVWPYLESLLARAGYSRSAT